MPDNVTTQAVQVASNVVPGMSLGEVGGLTGAVVAAAMVFATIWGKFKAGSSTDSAVTTLYSNLSEQIDKLTARLDAVEEERDVWQQKALELEGKVKALEGLEETHKRLIERLEAKDVTLDLKDKQIAGLLQDQGLKTATIMNLQERVRELEIKLERQLKADCVHCEHWKNSNGV